MKKHPQVLGPSKKEPEFFTLDCGYSPPTGCSPTAAEKYITTTLPMQEYIDSGGTMVTYEASTHIVRYGRQLSTKLRSTAPWLKLVISMREPLSRAVSMLAHVLHKRKGCLYRLGKEKMTRCLRTNSQLRPERLDNGTDSYTAALQAWLDEWPADQIHVMQASDLNRRVSKRMRKGLCSKGVIYLNFS